MKVSIAIYNPDEDELHLLNGEGETLPEAIKNSIEEHALYTCTCGKGYELGNPKHRCKVHPGPE